MKSYNDIPIRSGQLFKFKQSCNFTTYQINMTFEKRYKLLKPDDLLMFININNFGSINVLHKNEIGYCVLDVKNIEMYIEILW